MFFFFPNGHSYHVQEAFKKRELETTDKARRDCEDAARKEAERVAALHKAEVDSLNQK